MENIEVFTEEFVMCPKYKTRLMLCHCLCCEYKKNYFPKSEIIECVFDGRPQDKLNYK